MEKIINNFAVDHVLRGVMVDSTGKYMWSVNQITNPALNVTTENAQVVDALGARIVDFDRARNAELSAENSLFDLSLYAAQNGQSVKVATSTAKIVTPVFETLDVASNALTLTKTPAGTITEIYVINGDGTVAKTLEKVATEPELAAGKFMISGKDITTSGLTDGTQIFVVYDYEAEDNVEAVTVDAINFPKSGKFIMEVLGCDVCNPEALIHAYIEFPNAKLDGNVNYTFSSDSTHPFTIRANQAYCDKEKKLFRIIIPDEV